MYLPKSINILSTMVRVLKFEPHDHSSMAKRLCTLKLTGPQLSQVHTVAIQRSLSTKKHCFTDGPWNVLISLKQMGHGQCEEGDRCRNSKRCYYGQLVGPILFPGP